MSKERQSFICGSHEDCTTYGVEECNNPEYKLKNRNSSAHQTAILDTFACFRDFSLARLHFLRLFIFLGKEVRVLLSFLLGKKYMLRVLMRVKSNE